MNTFARKQTNPTSLLSASSIGRVQVAGLMLKVLAGASIALGVTPPATPITTTTPVAPDGITITTIRPDGSSVLIDKLPATDRVTAPPVQIAILLDTSGSMQGLVNQARAAIWDVVNTMAKARKNGQVPPLQVALYQYGSSKLPSGEGFLRMTLPFTSDLDLISKRLFELEITGSEEYCGQVMDAALKQLQWDTTSPTAPMAELPLRMIVIAGNEPFTQGPIDYRKASELAVAQGVFVNTIHCGEYKEGESTGWLDGAYRGKGIYSVIDQNKSVSELPTPFDADLSRLNEELNKTYVWYGSRGEDSFMMQSSQDSMVAASSRSAGLSRVAAKASVNYTNTNWDLIDATNANSVDIEKIPTTDLPENLRSMTIPQRKEYIDEMRRKREEIRARIAALVIEREAFLRKNRAGQSEDRFDQVIVKAIRKQAESLGYSFVAD